MHKCHLMLAALLLILCNLTAGATENTEVPKGVSHIINFAGAFEERMEVPDYTFEIGNFRFHVAQDASANIPICSKDAGLICMYKNNCITIETIDESNILSVRFQGLTFDPATTDQTPGDIFLYGDEITNIYGALTPEGTWVGKGPHVSIRTLWTNNVLNYVFIREVEIVTESSLAMSVEILKAEAVRATVGNVYYRLTARGAEGVEKFFIEAFDSDTQESFGRYLVEEEPGYEMLSEEPDEDNSGVKTYEGIVKIKNLKKHDLTNLHLCAVAQYADHEETSEPSQPVGITTVGLTTSIEEIEAEELPVLFYNLQGILVENPQNGIFIRRTGNLFEKIHIR